MTIEEARDDPEQLATGESARLAHTMATALGVPHLLRARPAIRAITMFATAWSRRHRCWRCSTEIHGSTANWPVRQACQTAVSADQRALAPRTADVAAGRIIAPSSCSDGEWWRRADTAERDASTRVMPRAARLRPSQPNSTVAGTGPPGRQMVGLDDQRQQEARHRRPQQSRLCRSPRASAPDVPQGSGDRQATRLRDGRGSEEGRRGSASAHAHRERRAMGAGEGASGTDCLPARSQCDAVLGPATPEVSFHREDRCGICGSNYGKVGRLR